MAFPSANIFGEKAKVSLSQRFEIENAVRTAAMDAVRGFNLPEALLSTIIDRATDDLNSGAGMRSLAERITLAAGLAEQYKEQAGHKPLNLLSATQAEIAARHAGLGLEPLDGRFGKQFASLRGGEGVDASGDSGSAAVSSSGTVRYAQVKEAGTSSGVSATTVAAYSREYAGMGLDYNSIHAFAATQLHKKDFHEIEKRWGRDEAVKGAHTAKDLGFKGKQGVGDVTAITDEEKRLLKDLGKEADKKKREEIEAKIRALPARKGESAKEKEERDKRNFKRLQDSLEKTGPHLDHNQRMEQRDKTNIRPELTSQANRVLAQDDKKTNDSIGADLLAVGKLTPTVDKKAEAPAQPDSVKSAEVPATNPPEGTPAGKVQVTAREDMHEAPKPTPDPPKKLAAAAPKKPAPALG